MASASTRPAAARPRARRSRSTARAAARGTPRRRSGRARRRCGSGAGGPAATARSDAVARQVPGRVVVALEVVDVEQRDAVDVPVALDAAAQHLEVLGQPQAVAEAGQRVVAGVVVQAPVQRGHAAGGDQLALELRDVERLEQQVVGARLHRRARRLLVGGAGEDHHVRVRGRAVGADRLGQRGAVHAGHLPVGDHHLGQPVLVAPPRLAPSSATVTRWPEPLHGGAHEQARARVVVCDQYVHGFAILIGHRGQSAQRSADLPGVPMSGSAPDRACEASPRPRSPPSRSSSCSSRARSRCCS